MKLLHLSYLIFIRDINISSSFIQKLTVKTKFLIQDPQLKGIETKACTKFFGFQTLFF